MTAGLIFFGLIGIGLVGYIALVLGTAEYDPEDLRKF